MAQRKVVAPNDLTHLDSSGSGSTAPDDPDPISGTPMIVTRGRHHAAPAVVHRRG
ncbi:MAG TPA: hypothetical protein VHM23_31945 [Actinomycetota bacterium]|nr:hypothetical protein [Actinomycetota bacterium]